MKKILIAIPSAKYIEVETFKSIYDQEIPSGYKTEFQYFFGYAVAQIRNLICHWAKHYDYLFFVDSDISFPSNTLTQLINADKDIVSGIYRQRLPEIAIEIYDHSFKRMQYKDLGNELIEVGGVGMGCCLIKSEVIKSIPYPQFEYHSAIDHKDTFSEDLDFCKKARNHGYSVWCIPTLYCNHHGSHVYTMESVVQSFEQELSQDPIKIRLQELHDTPLLPKDHIEYLQKLGRPNLNYPVIYDIGSCVLHWTNEAKKVWPNSKFILFEAMDEVEFLYQDYDYYLGLLGENDIEEKVFYQNLEHPGGNSYYPENETLSPHAKDLWGNPTKKITKRLDTVVKQNHFPLPDLIKMDIQGAELDVLKGAEKCLEHASALILELQHKDYNIGAPKRDEVIEWLHQKGFTCETMFCGSELDVDGDYFFRKRV